MHQCGTVHGNPMSSCSCDYSMLFPTSHDDHSSFNYEDPYTPSSVDCTLSLGTPATRKTNDKSPHNKNRHSAGSFLSNICWGSPTHKKNGNGNGDSLVARRCANCDTTSTPLWRNGPRGPKSLCNACGIRYKKEERRATANNNVTAAAPAIVESQHMMGHHQYSWGHHAPLGLINEFKFIDDESNNGVPFLSWRLNVPDRSSFVHDYDYYM
ncbi:hypothetical protein GIB67_005527 [Kingdonia uniflora]|uniref:GATA-type domain-containing protein n=1 Tax=Kingdonia uniflora TaxID=39325 RepID=A0A7J7NHJ7_9MAGN|nr:hypothetical protein GIB67_005527 [Kingdonia uniflora]